MGVTVLIVDDDPAFRRLASRLLTAAGFTVAGEAEDAGAAIAAAGAGRPDAILVDVRLPDRDGLDLARDLTALAWRPRVLLTSSDADALELADRRNGDVPPFVPKADLPGAPLGVLLGR